MFAYSGCLVFFAEISSTDLLDDFSTTGAFKLFSLYYLSLSLRRL
jgi:hypothetical protein